MWRIERTLVVVLLQVLERVKKLLAVCCCCRCLLAAVCVAQERRQTSAAASTAAEEGARLALKAAEHAAKLRKEGKKERDDLARKRGITFAQQVGQHGTYYDSEVCVPFHGAAVHVQLPNCPVLIFITILRSTWPDKTVLLYCLHLTKG